MTVPTPAGGHFPYVRVAGRCDVCGCESAELRYIKTRDAVPASATKPFQMERGLFVCGGHEADGAALVNPRVTLAPGTSKRCPQAEGLF